jgi:23S rRNA (uracil1939-C5)-methyltransferase
MDRVTLSALAHKGDAVAQIDGEAVYVDGGAPGDVVSINIEGKRPRIVALHEPSPHRVEPPCPQAGQCGGCTLQHLSDGFVAEWKREQVVSALAHRGIEADVMDTVTVPPRSRRRATFAARRSNAGVVIGFHEKASSHIVDVSPCLLVEPAIIEGLPALAQLLEPGLTRRGEARVSVTLSANGLDVAVEMPGKSLDRALLSHLSQAGQGAGLARLTWNNEPVAEWRPPVIEFDGLACVPPAGGFLQAVEQAESTLRARIVESATTRKRVKRVADLFSGCGAFSLPLARHAKVDAFDSDAAAINALDKATRNLQGLKPVHAEKRDLFRRPVFAPDLKDYDLAVIDPPRAGGLAQCEQLAKSKVPVVAAVSCNPATFARDARVLIDGGYRLGPVTPVDQFRWSPHVELVAVFERS